MKRIGLAFTGQPYSTREIVAAAKQAERLGYDSIWIAEDYWTGRDAISTLSCVALSTECIKVGTAVINPYIRHPVLIAMTLNSLWELAPERLLLGIGSGLPWKPLLSDEMERRPPLQAVRETINLLRSLMRGDAVSWKDEEVINLQVSRKCFSGAIPPAKGDLPIYIGATGPRMTELVGNVGDGLLLGTGTRADEIPERLDLLARGAERSRRNLEAIDVAAILVTSTCNDGTIHHNTLGYAAKKVAELDHKEAARLGFNIQQVDRIKEAYLQGQYHSALALLRPSMVSTFTVAGIPSRCLQTIQKYVEAGVKMPILLPFGGDLGDILELGAEYLREGDS